MMEQNVPVMVFQSFPSLFMHSKVEMGNTANYDQLILRFVSLYFISILLIAFFLSSVEINQEAFL